MLALDIGENLYISSKVPAISEQLGSAGFDQALISDCSIYEDIRP
jgi:hypothetical protein